MAYHATHRWGKTEKLPWAAFSELLKELDTNPGDIEHTSVSVSHESEWCISASKGGYDVFENLEKGEPRHMDGLPPDNII